MADASSFPAGLQRLASRLASMPPVCAMSVRIDRYDPNSGLRLVAPLAANVNDKGSAFGGSLAGLMTLSCWGSATLALDLAGITDAEVYVQDSSVQYLAPLYGDLLAEARLTDERSWDDFIRAYRERGRARATLSASVCCADGQVAASMVGRFVALRPR